MRTLETFRSPLRYQDKNITFILFRNNKGRKGPDTGPDTG